MISHSELFDLPSMVFIYKFSNFLIANSLALFVFSASLKIPLLLLIQIPFSVNLWRKLIRRTLWNRMGCVRWADSSHGTEPKSQVSPSILYRWLRPFRSDPRWLNSKTWQHCSEFPTIQMSHNAVVIGCWMSQQKLSFGVLTSASYFTMDEK